MQKPIILAKLGAPHGVQGWLKLHSFTQPPDNITKYAQFQIKQKNEWQAIQIDEIKLQGKSLLIKISEIDSPEQARPLTNCLIGVNRGQLPQLESGKYYWCDLVGLEVRNLAHKKLGKIDYLFETGANDVIVIKDDQGKEHLLPYTDDAVKEIDLQTRSMRVDWETDF